MGTQWWPGDISLTCWLLVLCFLYTAAYRLLYAIQPVIEAQLHLTPTTADRKHNAGHCEEQHLLTESGLQSRPSLDGNCQLITWLKALPSALYLLLNMPPAFHGTGRRQQAAHLQAKSQPLSLAHYAELTYLIGIINEVRKKKWDTPVASHQSSLHHVESFVKLCQVTTVYEWEGKWCSTQWLANVCSFFSPSSLVSQCYQWLTCLWVEYSGKGTGL